MDPDTWVPALLETLKSVSFPDAKIVLRDMYLHNSGLYPILNKNVSRERPLASVALHESENIFKTSRLNAAIETFVTKEIAKHTNLSLMEYLELPHDYVIMINSAVQTHSKVLDSVGSQMVNQLESMKIK